MDNKRSVLIGCSVIEDLLPSYVDGICSGESKGLVEEHVADCPSCRERLRRMQETEGLEINMPEQDGDILDITKRLQEQKKKQKRTNGVLGAVSCVLAACLIVSLVPKGNIVRPADGEDSGSTTVATAVTETKEPAADFGEYTMAASYEEIYQKTRDYYDSMDDYGYWVEDSMVFTEETATDSMADGGASNGAMAPQASQSLERPVAEEMREEVSADKGDDSEFSSTNIMTEGVDESDISKTDGNYIYNATGSQIVIFDIQGGEAEKVTNFTPKFKSSADIIREIYVDGDLMTVLTDHESYEDGNFRSQVVVLIYDISDRKNPDLKGSRSQDGSFKSARKVGDIIYLFTDRYITDPGDDRTYALGEGLSRWFPLVNEEVVPRDCVYLPESGQNALVISSFNQNEPGRTIDTKVIVNEYAQLYMGSESIYLYSQVFSGGRDITRISKISYKEGALRTGESNMVRGHLNDPFAINESGGYLRIVTTEWDGGTNNMLYVLDGNLNEVGRISDIARGEQLYSCRFMGDTGYFVTYETTDPLFTVDLSDPTNPRVIGELELLGFSEYLHFWEEGKLLGIGYDSDEDGFRQGLKLSMFDISDPANVTEESRLVLSDVDYAPAFENYKAFMVSPRANLFGFAHVSYTEKGTDAAYDVYSYEDGQFVKRLSEQMKESGVYRARGHFRGEYFYLAKDTEVVSRALTE